MDLVRQLLAKKNPYGMGDFEKKTMDISKENVTKLVLAGYDFVINGIKRLTPAQLNEPIKVFDGPPLRPLRHDTGYGTGKGFRTSNPSAGPNNRLSPIGRCKTTR